MKNKRLCSLLLAMIFAGLLCLDCHAGSWGGRDTLNPGGPAGTGTSGGNEHRTMWLHYRFLNNEGTTGLRARLYPQWNNGSKRPEIGEMCAAPGVGFWVLANASNGSYSEPGACVTNDENGYYKNKVAEALGVEAENLGYPWFYRSEIGCNPTSGDPYLPVSDYGAVNDGYFYINKTGTGWAAYDTLSADVVGNLSNIAFDKSVTAQQTYYYNHKAIYENDKIANSNNGGFSTVAKDFKTFSRIDSVSNDLDDNATDEDVWNQMKSEKIYAFCSFPDNKSAKLESKSHIEVYQNDSKITEKASDGYGKTSTNEKAVEVEYGSSIKIQYFFDYYRHDTSDFATGTLEGDSAISVYRKASNGEESNHSHVSTSANTPSFNTGVQKHDTQNKNAGFSKEGGVTVSLAGLAGGETYTYCATVSHSSKITTSSTSSTGSGSASSGACVTIKVKDPITVDVHSNTIAEIDSDSLVDPNGQTTFASGMDKSYTSDIITVKPGGVLNVDWGHYIGYNNVTPSGAKVNEVWTETYNIWGGSDLGHKLKISEYSDPGNNFGSYYWSHLNYNNDFSHDYPSASANHPWNQTTVRLFPGEENSSDSKKKQVLKHPKTVYANAQGSNDAGNGTAESSVELKIKGDYVTCGIDSDHSYQIGVDAPNDYRWLKMTRNDNRSLTVGNDLAVSGNFWLRPDNTVRLTQTACFGSQIARDAENSSNRWTTNPWGDNRDDISKNTQFALETGLNNALFNGTTGASATSSHSNKSLRASEIGVSNFSNSSSPASRIENEYKIEATSKDGTAGDVGKTIDTSFANPEGEAVTISAKIPYNYYLNVDGLNGGGGMLFGGNTAFNAKVKSMLRKNIRVCAGTEDESARKTAESNCDEYITASKETKLGMYVFAMGSDFSLSQLSGKDSFVLERDDIFVGDIEAKMRDVINNQLGAMPDGVAIGSRKNGLINNGGPLTASIADSRGSVTLGSGSFNTDSYPVGTKICAAVAMFPADSHDLGFKETVAFDDDQSSALRDSGTKTGFKISCRTVAKYQTMSVEGNGIATSGAISSSEINYNGRPYTSWSEYQIVASGSNASSAAVTAYEIGHRVTSPNEKATQLELSGSIVSVDSLLYPQTLGNSKSDYMGGAWIRQNNADYEAAINWTYAETLKKNIIDTYGGGKECKTGDLGNNNYLVCETGDTIHPVDYGSKDTLIVRSKGDLRITNGSNLNDLSYWGNPKRLIIIAHSISIANEVGDINAWLIVDGGELNTCWGRRVWESNGNELLLDYCKNPLVINGPVIVDGTLQLPRTFGGGSLWNESSRSFEKDLESLTQRAEIFNYDPSVVEWAYKESQKNPHLETTYTETLAPRL